MGEWTLLWVLPLLFRISSLQSDCDSLRRRLEENNEKLRKQEEAALRSEVGQFSVGAVNFVEITLLLVVALLVLYWQSNSTSKKHVMSCVFKVFILILCYTFIYFTQHLLDYFFLWVWTQKCLFSLQEKFSGMIASSRADFEKVRPIMKLVLFLFYSDIVVSKKVWTSTRLCLKSQRLQPRHKAAMLGVNRIEFFNEEFTWK